MPKIGARIIKTSLAVWLCFLITLIRGSGIPFYSAIAAILCTQPELNDSLSKGKSRIIATLIGGFVGMGMLYLFQQGFTESHDLLRYTLISAMMIPLIYLTVIIKQPASSYLTCVVFLCVTVTHAGDSDPFLFAINRMFDTCIGILVAVVINAIQLPHRRHRDVMMEVPLDYLFDEQGKITTRTRVQLNRMIKEGANIMVTSHKTPAHLISYCAGIEEPLTCILMDGVIRYERQRNRCTPLHTMPYAVWSIVIKCLQKHDISLFCYEVVDDLLYIHHGPYHNEQDHAFYMQEYKSYGQCFITHEKSVDAELHRDLVMMMALIRETEWTEIQKQLAPLRHELTWILYDDERREEGKRLCIYPYTIISGQSYESDSSMYKVRHASVQDVPAVLREMKHVFYHGQ